MTRLERAYPRRRTLGAVACLQCLPPREGPELQTVRPDMPRPPVRISGTQDSVGSWKVTPADRQEPGETRPSPNLRGHWPYRPRGGVLPVLYQPSEPMTLM